MRPLLQLHYHRPTFSVWLSLVIKELLQPLIKSLETHFCFMKKNISGGLNVMLNIFLIQELI